MFALAAALTWLSQRDVVADEGDAEKVRNITFDDIKIDIKKGQAFKRSMLTDKVQEIDGSAVSLRGYILPSFQQKGITQFVLVRDNMECCFGPGAALYDCVVVEMEKGKSTSYTVRPVTVEGEFTVDELVGPDGTHLAIYHIRGLSVK
jgi:hypothetical protein